MEIRPIRTEQDYRTALTEISQLIDKDPARERPTATGWTFSERWLRPTRPGTTPSLPDPIDALRLLMESGA